MNEKGVKLLSNQVKIRTQRRGMVQVLCTLIHQVRSLLQNTRGLLRSARSPPETYAAQRYALINYAQSRLAQAQPDQVQHCDQLSQVVVRESGRIHTVNESEACIDINDHPKVFRKRQSPIKREKEPNCLEVPA